MDDQPSIHDSLTITVTVVFEALISLDIEKPSGMDKISPRVLQSCATLQSVHSIIALHYFTF